MAKVDVSSTIREFTLQWLRSRADNLLTEQQRGKKRDFRSTGALHGRLGNGVCPVCFFLANVLPQSEGLSTIHCGRCGDFDLSDSAADVLGDNRQPLDRSRLTEIVCDLRSMAECERPLIDSVTASVLVALAAAEAQQRHD